MCQLAQSSPTYMCVSLNPSSLVLPWPTISIGTRSARAEPQPRPRGTRPTYAHAWHWLRDPRRSPYVVRLVSSPCTCTPYLCPLRCHPEVTERHPRPSRTSHLLALYCADRPWMCVCRARGPTPHVTTATKIARHATPRRDCVSCDASLLHPNIAAVLVPVPFFAPAALQLLPRPRPPLHRNQYLAPPRPQWHATPPHQKDTVALHRKESARRVYVNTVFSLQARDAYSSAVCTCSYRNPHPAAPSRVNDTAAPRATSPLSRAPPHRIHGRVSCASSCAPAAAESGAKTLVDPGAKTRGADRAAPRHWQSAVRSGFFERRGAVI
ncbi:hypothetical protein C8J57DRAFT_1502523 [Mycena rebaudengoi]|nr:hypothetical protein C8J57DRAFT_1502523 [Mycena rebaudengoi]